MTQNTFKPEDYFDLSLCDALDRIARAAGIIDAHPDPVSKRFRDMPSEAAPWLFIDWQRFDAERRREEDDENSPINVLLRSRPVFDEAEASRLKIAEMEATARQRARRAFEDAVEPLFAALRAGSIVAKGFVKRKNQADVNATAIDGARWRMEWQVRRDGRVAICEFFTNRADEDAEVTLTALDLVAPVVAANVAVTNMTPGAAGAFRSQAPGALAELRKLGAGDPSKPQRKRGGGRQPKYRWIEAERALAAKIYADGIPKQGDGGQAGLEKFMQDWFAENGRPDDDGEPEIPSESLIREHVKRVIEAHMKTVHEGR